MKSQCRFTPNGVRNKPESVSGFIGISKYEKKEKTSQKKDAATVYVSLKTRRGIDSLYEDR